MAELTVILWIVNGALVGYILGLIVVMVSWRDLAWAVKQSAIHYILQPLRLYPSEEELWQQFFDSLSKDEYRRLEEMGEALRAVFNSQEGAR